MFPSPTAGSAVFSSLTLILINALKTYFETDDFIENTFPAKRLRSDNILKTENTSKRCRFVFFNFWCSVQTGACSGRRDQQKLPHCFLSSRILWHTLHSPAFLSDLLAACISLCWILHWIWGPIAHSQPFVFSFCFSSLFLLGGWLAHMSSTMNHYLSTSLKPPNLTHVLFLFNIFFILIQFGYSVQFFNNFQPWSSCSSPSQGSLLLACAPY